MNRGEELSRLISRRHFLRDGSDAIGWAAFSSLLGLSSACISRASSIPSSGALTLARHAGRAKHVIYLHMVGGPPQVDMFDHKPAMNAWFNKELPSSIRMGQRLTTMTSGQARFPIAPSKYAFAKHGECGMWVSELLPWTSKIVDDLCFVRSMHTEAINHEPAISFIQTGNQVTGRPCLGAWASYGLGSLNENLPTFVVLVARPSNTEELQAISARLWSAGYLPGQNAGVSFRSDGDPILYIKNPPGVSAHVRRTSLDTIRSFNEMALKSFHDPETQTRIEQYELAFKMQGSVPELTNFSAESAATMQLYGNEAAKPGTFANSVLLARRLVERGVRFVQIYHNNWDTHGNIAGRLPSQCKDIDQGCFALIQDLKQRGLLDETLVVWGGEFGRTIYSQGGLSHENYGRDHHPRCFTMWLAGGGIKGGTVYGETDDFSYNIARDPVHVRDFLATVLHLLGFDHERFTYPYQGLDQRLTGVERARVVTELIS